MDSQNKPHVYKLVLTGGPCGGKTTGQARVCTLFESMGWKVFRVPETATILIGGGVQFQDLSHDESIKFQENLLKTMIQIENTYFDLASTSKKNCLVICDRGVMDASAYMDKEEWDNMLKRNGLDPFELHEKRYNQVVHMVSAAHGAERFYTTRDHKARTETLEMAREVDNRASAAWLGHPYFDLIDNSSDFDHKILRLLSTICKRMELNTGDRVDILSKKFKFLVKGPLPADADFPASYQDFKVTHHYLVPNKENSNAQDRLRKRGKDGHYSYVLTSRSHVSGQTIEKKREISEREYEVYLSSSVDNHHLPVEKIRRCMIIENQYFHLDIYKKPDNARCKGLVFLETYSTLEVDELAKLLPSFLKDVEHVTGKPDYSMFNLSLRDDCYADKFYLYSNGNKQHQMPNPSSSSQTPHTASSSSPNLLSTDNNISNINPNNKSLHHHHHHTARPYMNGNCPDTSSTVPHIANTKHSNSACNGALLPPKCCIKNGNGTGDVNGRW